jgi:lipoate-protein ligase B
MLQHVNDRCVQLHDLSEAVGVQIEASGASIEYVDRGGEVTFHGPGQWVCYPVYGLRDLGCGARAFVKGLENSVVATVGAWGLQASGDPGSAAGVRA